MHPQLQLGPRDQARMGREDTELLKDTRDPVWFVLCSQGRAHRPMLLRHRMHLRLRGSRREHWTPHTAGVVGAPPQALCYEVLPNCERVAVWGTHVWMGGDQSAALGDAD